MIDEFLLQLGGHLGATDVEKIQHFVTFLSSQREKKKEKYQQSLQLYHRNFQPSELATAKNQLYIVFIPMTKSGMQIKVLHNKNDTFSTFLFFKVSE